MASNNYIYKMSNAGGMSTIMRYTDMLAGNPAVSPFAPAGAYESIATTTVGATAQSSVTFSGIPATYTHLQVRAITRTNFADYNNIQVRFNGDTASNYSWHYLLGNGSAASASASTSQTSMQVGLNTSPSQSANVFSANVIDVLDYTSTNKNKTVRTLSGADSNGSGYAILWSGLWYKTPEAITSITLLPQTGGGDFAQYSSFALYGIRGN
jgi:hypothetical protein